MRITELELTMLKAINADYRTVGIENTEFYNTFGIDADTNKELRGAFTSLKRKKIINHYNDPGCFNPIYPTRRFIDIMNANGEDVPESVKSWVRHDEAYEEYGDEFNAWLSNNGGEWTDPDTNTRYSARPFSNWVKEYHGVTI